MNVERVRELLVSLPHVLEAEQFGGLIYWVGDKAIGGKMFAMINFEPGQGHAAMFPVGAERFDEMCERDGLLPAPYMARNFWVAVERWDGLRNSEWEAELGLAHALTYAKLTAKTKALLALPKGELKKAVAERKKVLAARKAVGSE